MYGTYAKHVQKVLFAIHANMIHTVLDVTIKNLARTLMIKSLRQSLIWHFNWNSL